MLSLTLGMAAALASLISCSSSSADTHTGAPEVNVAQELYNKKCSLCHGMTGDKQLSGAKKLTESELTIKEIETIVTGGLRQMPSFSAQLTAAEIEQISEYAYSFRTK